MSIELEKLKTATAMTWVDKFSCAGLIGGTTISLFTQQAAFATVPISLIMTAQIFARQQKISALVETHQQTAEVVQMIETTAAEGAQKVENTFQTHDRNIDNLTQESNKHNLEFMTVKERLEEQSKSLAKQAGQLDALESTLLNIKEITAVSSLESGSASAEVHFTRGTHQEELGHLEIAIEDYSQAIERSQDFAEAYLRRGLAKSKLGRKQSAVIDLNLATKHFFESGDLNNYQRAKDIASKLHTGDNTEEAEADIDETNNAAPELMSVNSLFGG